VRAGSSETGSPILGVFNTSSRPLVELIPLSSFTGAVRTQDYVVRSHTIGTVSSRLRAGDDEALVSVSLDVMGYDILTATPLVLLPGDRFEQIGVGDLGLVDKMTGSAAIVGTHVTKLENRRIVVDTQLKALGVFGECCWAPCSFH
jgi:hypothetical protein